MLVGAPKANTSQPGVLQGGAVYLCPWGAGRGHCTPIEFDSKGNPRGQEGTPGGDARVAGEAGARPAGPRVPLGLQLRLVQAPQRGPAQPRRAA